MFAMVVCGSRRGGLTCFNSSTYKLRSCTISFVGSTSILVYSVGLASQAAPMDGVERYDRDSEATK